MYLLIKLVVFHCYVSLPEGKSLSKWLLMFFLDSIFVDQTSLNKSNWVRSHWNASTQKKKRNGPHRARGSQIPSSFSHNHGSVENGCIWQLTTWRYTHFLLPWLWENMVITTTALPLETESLGAPSQELARVEPVLGPATWVFHDGNSGENWQSKNQRHWSFSRLGIVFLP